MLKSKKIEIVNYISELYSSNEFVFLLKFSSLDSSSNLALRSSLYKKTKDRIVVLRNKLHSIVIKDSSINSSLANLLTGNVCAIFTNKPIEVANLISLFIKKNESKLSLISMLSTKDSLPNFTFEEFSKYENFNSLRTKLARLISAPCKNLAFVLNQKASCSAQ